VDFKLINVQHIQIFFNWVFLYDFQPLWEPSCK
jgi:hypothetical protein